MKRKSEIKKEIAARESIISDAEKRIKELQIIVENNKQWVVELKEQLKDKKPCLTTS